MSVVTACKQGEYARELVFVCCVQSDLFDDIFVVFVTLWISVYISVSQFDFYSCLITHTDYVGRNG